MTTHDVAVIGSGPVGIAAARRLAEHGLKVVVLEAGAAVSDPPGSHVRNQARHQADQDGYFAAVGHYMEPMIEPGSDGSLTGQAEPAMVGGKGIIWTNNCPRPADFELWDAMAADRWDHYFTAAESMLEVLPDPTANSRTGAAVAERMRAPLAAAGRAIRGLPFSGRVDANGKHHYLAPHDMLQAMSVEARSRIELRSSTRVTQVRTSDGRVTGCDLIDDRGTVTDLKVPVVIVAGGAIATPRLLYRSGIRPQELGRGLSYHFIMFAQLVLDPDLCPGADIVDQPPRLWVPPTPERPWHSMILRDTCPLPSEQTVANPHQLLEFQVFSSLGYRDQSRLLMDQADRYAFDISLTKQDKDRCDNIRAEVEQWAGHLGGWRRGCEPRWLWRETPHLVGTHRMDTAGWPGVTDRRGEVHGVQGLFLAGLGLIPVEVSVNPTLTAVALALRTCDEVVATV